MDGIAGPIEIPHGNYLIICRRSPEIDSIEMRKPNLPSVCSILLLFITFPCSVVSSLTSLPKGAHLSVENYESDVLVSPGGTFSCGFHSVAGANAFSFSIWFSLTDTVVWTANRDKPVNGGLSRMELRDDGSMVLTDGGDGTVVWSTSDQRADADHAVLLETGSLVVRDVGGRILWQSMDYPTDTLLPGQPITKTRKLVSSTSISSLSSGDFTLSYDSDNVLRLVYDSPDISSIYWPNPARNVWDNGRTLYNSSRYGVLNSMGQFVSSDRLAFNASDMGSPGVWRRLALDPDGNLRLYSLDARARAWSITWQAISSLCDVHGLCGRNGICIYTPDPKCSCPPGYQMANPSNWREGCRPNHKGFNCSKLVKFVEVPYTDFYGYDMDTPTSVSFANCSGQCAKNCDCQGFMYRKNGEGICYMKAALFNGRRAPDFIGSMYIKFPEDAKISDANLTVFDLSCNMSASSPVAPVGTTSGSRKGISQWGYRYVTVIVFGLTELLFILIGWWFLYGGKQAHSPDEEGYGLLRSQFRKFSYQDLKQATGNFREEIGRGASGEVFRGVLNDKRVVAVKKLPDVDQGEEEFQAELSMIGRIYHMNLVRMWGFCLEHSRRLLVYEYVERGSLDRVLFHEDVPLEWNKRFKVALGVAKGLAYLHHECLEWVIHCDIKPENILLDDGYEPKIADFGLVQLTQRDESGLNLTGVRGTKGYMAPEWTSNVALTAKVDVYSYGIILLELLRGSRIPEGWNLGRGNHELRERMVLEGEFSVLQGLVDPRLNGQYNTREAKELLELAVSCSELDRNKRPTMDSVVDTLLRLSRDDDQQPQ